MLAILQMLGMLVADVLKSRMRLEAENLFLRHQLEYRIAAGATSSPTARQRQGADGFAGSALAQPAWCGPGG